MIDDTRNEIRKLEINNSSDLPRFCNVSSYEMGFFFFSLFPQASESLSLGIVLINAVYR